MNDSVADILESIEDSILQKYGKVIPISCINWGLHEPGDKPFVLVTVNLPTGTPVDLPKKMDGIDIVVDYGTIDLFEAQ